jgi:hypothetical protein
MILTVAGEFGPEEYIVCPRAPITISELRQRMLERAKVAEGSYAYSLVDDLHTGIFVQSLDLKADYETYFASEYRSFGEYLCRRARLPSGVVRTLTGGFEGSAGMYHFRPRHSFLNDASGLDLLSRLLEDPPEREEPS